MTVRKTGFVDEIVYAAMLVAISLVPDLNESKSRDDSRDGDIARRAETINDQASKGLKLGCWL